MKNLLNVSIQDPSGKETLFEVERYASVAELKHIFSTATGAQVHHLKFYSPSLLTTELKDRQLLNEIQNCDSVSSMTGLTKVISPYQSENEDLHLIVQYQLRGGCGCNLTCCVCDAAEDCCCCTACLCQEVSCCGSKICCFGCIASLCCCC